ncbi:MAG: SH3 domain-containing protein [Candidatus Aminicenantes bacterium]|nr:SH3 domain-containing protein [Candidatus Aminicenantes bacterium]
MKIKSGIKVLGSLFLLIGLICPKISLAQVNKVRIVVKNSSIRTKPDMRSEVIGSPPLGAVFEVLEKGEIWYKVQLDPGRYQREQGYLNKMFIEEFQGPETSEEKELKEKKAAIKEEDEAQNKEMKPEKQDKEIQADDEEIQQVVRDYIDALQNNQLLSFYNQNSTSGYFEQASEDAEWIARTYDQINACVSDTSVRSRNEMKAEVQISLIITGRSRVGGNRKLLFEGVYVWSMVRKNDSWRISQSESQPYR